MGNDKRKMCVTVKQGQEQMNSSYVKKARRFKKKKKKERERENNNLGVCIVVLVFFFVLTLKCFIFD